LAQISWNSPSKPEQARKPVSDMRALAFTGNELEVGGEGW